MVGTGRNPTLGGAQKHSHCLWSKLPKIWAEAPVYNPCNFYSTQQTLHGPFRGPGPCGMPTKALLLKSVCITGPKHKPLRARAAGGGATGIGALENHAHKSGAGGRAHSPTDATEGAKAAHQKPMFQCRQVFQSYTTLGGPHRVHLQDGFGRGRVWGRIGGPGN